jgi:hypothetical protein
MKIAASKTLIIVAILASGLGFGQNSQPKKIAPPVQINHKGETGLFVTFEFMDLSAEKLIERKGLLNEKKTLNELVKNLKAQAEASGVKSELLNVSFNTSESLRLKAEAQITLLNGSLANQVQITTNNKRKARRNGLILFGGGVAVGVTVFALLL